MPACLEDLPNELLIQVLSALNPSGLLALTSVSPLCLKVFDSNRTRLSQVIAQRTILSENFEDAVRACAIPSVKNPVPKFFKRWYGYINRSDCHWIRPFPEGHVESQFQPDFWHDPFEVERNMRGYSAGPGSKHTETPRWERLLKLCIDAEYFIDEFVKYSLPRMPSLVATHRDKHLPKLLTAISDQPTTLSPTEYGRLQRGFFKFEVYRRASLAGLCIHDWHPKELIRELHHVVPVCDYIGEELSSVFIFMRRQLEEIVNEVGRSLISEPMDLVYDGLSSRFLEERPRLDDAQQLPESDQNFSTNDTSLSTPSASRPQGGTSDASNRRGRKRRGRPWFLDNLVLLGVGFLRHLKLANLPRKRSLITYLSRRLYFQIKPPWPEIWYAPVHIGFDIMSWDDSLECASAAWRWVRSSKCLDGSPEDFSLKAEVASVGIVFWDRWRLYHLGVFDVPLHQIQHSPHDQGWCAKRNFLDQLARYEVDGNDIQKLKPSMGDEEFGHFFSTLEY